MSAHASKSAMCDKPDCIGKRYAAAALDGLNQGVLRERQREQKPQRGDGIRPNQCPRCGYRGPHKDAEDCINALRDRLAKYE